MDIFLIDLGDPLYLQELDLRFRVLRKPLGMTRGSEVFEFEAECLHYVTVSDGRVIGCVLFHPQSGSDGRLLQMAVDDAWQQKGVGRQLVRHLEVELVRRGVEEVVLHARDIAVGFYEKLDYACVGRPYVEVGIAHCTMRRRLVP